jgi:hypothetical protein
MRTRLIARAAFVALVPLLATACAALFPNTPQAKFEESQRHYTQSVRWGNYPVAMTFVDPQSADEFRARALSFGDLRFTDYHVLSVKLDPVDHRSAVAHVTYIAYRPSSPVAVAFDEEQHWAYTAGSWVVRPQLAEGRPAQPGEVAF